MPTIVAYQHTGDIIDKETVITLIQEQMAFIGYQQSREEVEAEVNNAMKKESRSALFVAYEGGSTAIGFAYGNICSGLETGGDYFWLNELYVSESCRKQGLGSDLLGFVRTWSQEMGCGYLAMVTHPNNKKAQALYQELGFELEKLVWVDKYL
ncbi:GNAT family N-acetyltransferase [Sphaerochaeta sp. PS]|uniref:GNAT family N-acetyltransferase n=1 Tax=Sphaerochaeta sp. PS TaxID=3076336 RepID=UPI0028A4C261|nr:GNAT family N-acetyltransferase [Sphaerochaeta sp. PS]MDT4761028.1 GNAT family N-acetyltransferase [Sphaerochaeta sp. PS]